MAGYMRYLARHNRGLEPLAIPAWPASPTVDQRSPIASGWPGSPFGIPGARYRADVWKPCLDSAHRSFRSSPRHPSGDYLAVALTEAPTIFNCDHEPPLPLPGCARSDIHAIVCFGFYRHIQRLPIAPQSFVCPRWFGPGPFPDRAASLLPGLLAATRTGLPGRRRAYEHEDPPWH